MSALEDVKKFRSVLIRHGASMTLSDPQRAEYTPSSINIRPLKKAGMLFQSNIERRDKPVWIEHIDVDWDQMPAMMTAVDIALPTGMDDHKLAAEELARHMRRWGRENLKKQIGVCLVGGLVPRLRVLFETKQDIVKWKLAWHGL